MARISRRTFLRDAAGAVAGGSALGALLATACGRGETRLADPGTHPVVVVGCGGVGIMAATALVQKGVPVLCLDGGPLNSLEESRKHPPGVPSEPYRTPAGDFLWQRLRQVGGRLTRWQGHCPRFSPRNLVEGGEISPELVWPLRYEDLAPYYTKAERILGVTGRAAGIPDLPDGEYVASLAYRSIDHHVAHVARELGAELTPGRYALYPNAARTSRLGTQKIPRDRKAESFIGGVFNSLLYVYEELLKNELFALVPDAVALHVQQGPTTDAPEIVTYFDAIEGREVSVKTNSVVMAAGCLESTKILLNSTSARFPEGLGNSSGTLGLFLTDHAQCWTPYRFPRHLIAAPTPPSDDLQHGGQYGTYLVCNQKGLRERSPALHGRFTFQLKALPEQKGLAFGGTCMVDSRPENRIRLSGETTAAGSPIPEIHFTHSDADRRRIERMVEASQALAEACGGTAMRDPWLGRPGGTIHYGGTCRMGGDSRTSMLDGFCESHEVPNLFVVDGGAFVTNPEKNGTLTMMALALRAGERLGTRLRG